jgi:hypothetical protein
MNATQMIRLTVMWLLIAASSGCNSQSPREAQTEPAAAAVPSLVSTPKEHNLTIYGYNYTDTEIGSFEVNGQGGGNLPTSSPTAGGGSSVCCLTVFTPTVKPKTVKIKWTRDLDTWCEQEVVLAPFAEPNPKYFEVHFYPDGHIELAITEDSSDPRLKLEAASEGSRHKDKKLNINNDSKFARCKRGYS